jgi:hypothetical protein
MSQIDKDKVTVFDYWAFHDNGNVQFFQVTGGEVTDYRRYLHPEEAPVIRIDERTWNPDFVGPIRHLRYYGQSYVKPV